MMFHGFFMLSKITGVVITFGMLANIASLKTAEAFLQYGAFGLCALMMYGVYKMYLAHLAERRELVDTIKVKDAALLKVIQDNNTALNRIGECLEDRPCLKGDQRVLNKTET